MSNVPKNFLQVEDFLRYSDAKGISINECPACHKGADEAALMLENLMTGLPFMVDYSTLASGNGAPVVKTKCSNCGFVWLFDGEDILEWLAANPKQEATKG